jgi:hypothetical protein
MDCWIVIVGRKLQNFTARSYRFAAALCVFHLIHGLPNLTPDPLI